MSAYARVYSCMDVLCMYYVCTMYVLCMYYVCIMYVSYARVYTLTMCIKLYIYIYIYIYIYVHLEDSVKIMSFKIVGIDCFKMFVNYFRIVKI